MVRTLRKQYAATLLDDGQYRRALPELRRLADERAAEAGQADPQSLRHRYEAAQCLEQLGDPAAALAEYRALLPYYENQYVAAGDPQQAHDVRRRIGHLLLALGDRAAAHDTLVRLLHDVERVQGPGHPLAADIRRTLQWLGQVRGSRGRVRAGDGGRGGAGSRRESLVEWVGQSLADAYHRSPQDFVHRRTSSPQEVSLHRRRRTALLLTAAIAAAPLLTACGNDAHPGAAAVVGGERITVSQLENRVDEVRAAQRAAVPDDAQYQQAIAQTGGLTRDTLHSMVLDRVLERAARDAGVTVSDREVQRTRAAFEEQAGGAKALEAAWLQQYGVPPQRLDDNLRLLVTAQKLAQKLGTDTGRPEFWKALSDASEELDVDLNPRYGEWDAEKSSRVDAKTPWVKDVTAVDGPPLGL